jgi:hypothetical protein
VVLAEAVVMALLRTAEQQALLVKVILAALVMAGHLILVEVVAELVLPDLMLTYLAGVTAVLVYPVL